MQYTIFVKPNKTDRCTKYDRKIDKTIRCEYYDKSEYAGWCLKYICGIWGGKKCTKCKQETNND